MFIKENVVNLKLGLSKEYKLIQFSDTHLVTYNNADTLEEIEYAKKMEDAWYDVRVDFAKHFNEEYDNNLLSSKECFDHLIEYTNIENPDCLLLSGDIIDYYSSSNFSYLEERLLKLNYPFLFACGNHETPLSLYKMICKDDIEYQEFDEIFIVSVDDSNKEFSINQLQKLQELLLKNKLIILLMHIPIITKYNEEDMKVYDKYFTINYKISTDTTKEFINLIVNSDNVKAIFCGHTHGYSVSNFGLNKPQYIASSGLIGFVNKIIIN